MTAPSQPTAASRRVETTIPGRAPIELVAFYEELRDYYPQCELETKRWFVDHVRPDWWILDIGANIGYYTILFAQLAPAGRVLAFEPTTTAAMLRDNLRHNNIANADVHEIALGAKTGVQQDRIFRIWGTEGEVKTYPFYKLDDFISQHRIERVDCLKIDVDSFDFEVLRGAEQTLLKHNPVIVIELNHALAKRDQSGTEALAWLARRGYRQALVLDHYDNFVLQRGEDLFSDVSGAASLQLLFPPPVRIDERMAYPEGDALDASFMTVGELHNGAIARVPQTPPPARSWWERIFYPRRQPPAPPVQFAWRDIVDVPIETTPDRWSYAFSLQFEPKAPQGSLTIAVGVEVITGNLGIVLCGEDQSQFCAPERVLAAMPGLQHVVLSAPGRDVRFLTFRNVADDGTRTLFRIASVEGRTNKPT